MRNQGSGRDNGRTDSGVGRHRFGRLGAAMVCGCMALGSSAPAMAQGGSSASAANAAYSDIRDERRTDLVLLPAVVAMDEPPAASDRRDRAARLTSEDAGWAAAEAWANRPAQRAALEALATVTSERDWRRSFAFGQPYGAGGVDEALVRADAYTDLGEPPTLGLARFGYLRHLDRLAALTHIEATRLQSEGDPAGAMRVAGDLVFVGRQMADRVFADEVRWGLRAMSEGLERVRAIAYEDYAGPRTLSQEALRDAIERFDMARGYLDLNRLSFPRGERLAVEEVMARVFNSGGGVESGTFGTTLARLDSGPRPLRLFGQSAAWSGRASRHASRTATEQELARAYDDWAQRWALDPFHPRMSNAAYFDALDDDRFAVVVATLGDMGDLFEVRRRARLEIAGTRTSLALVGYIYQFRRPPPVVSAVRGGGRWIERLDADPYNPQGGATGGPPLEYFVPGPNAPGGALSWTIEVDLGGETLEASVGEDGFVLYSWGPDNQKDWARRAARDPADADLGADVLLWPPVLALERARGD